jgi:hypothetical protein
MTGYIRSHINLTSFQIVNQESRLLHEKWNELKNFGDEDISSAIWDKKSPNIQARVASSMPFNLLNGLFVSRVNFSFYNLQFNLVD